jgi:Rrf2 family protein
MEAAMANMLKISEAASLGLHIMALLAADPDKLLSVREAAGALQVSEAHLAKVMQRLAKAGLVESLRGPRGGFLLARAPEEITLLEVYEAIEGPIVVRNCLFSTRLCDGEHCIFGGMLTSVDAQVKQYLGDTKLSEIANVVRPAKEDAHA